MKIILTMILFICANYLFAQKLVIDSVAYSTWPKLDWPTISKNGQYVYYSINNVPAGSKTLVIQSVNGKWKKEFIGGVKEGQNMLSDKYFLFINKNDSLGMLRLGSDQIQYIPKVSWCNLNDNKRVEYLLYPSSLNPKGLVLKNLKTNRERVFKDVDNWSFQEDILVLVKSIQSNGEKKTINVVDIATGKISKIWEGYKPENLVFDVKHKQLAFKTSDSIWYYKIGLIGAVCVFNKKISNIVSDFSLGDLGSFSKNGKFLSISLIEGRDEIKPKYCPVEIWSYTDIILPPEKRRINKNYIAIVDLLSYKLIRCQMNANEELFFSDVNSGVDSLVLVRKGDNSLEKWRSGVKPVWSLRNILNETEIKLPDNIQTVHWSHTGKFLIYFDNEIGDYYSYEVLSRKYRNISNNIKIDWIDSFRDDLPQNLITPRGINSNVWLYNDEAVLVYDKFDIWKLDPLNKQLPINVTNGYGRKNQIVFSFADEAVKYLHKEDKLNLLAFNNENKNNGFFSKQLNKIGDPILLNMGNYIYNTNSGYVPEGSNFAPIKAKESETYIVQRMSVKDAPNYFSTKDFKNFIRLSNLQPQNQYNWYTTELYTWRSLDGENLKGVLYKPYDFDPNKKYSVIFQYYERKSDGLNAFIKPEVVCSGCNIDIPTYVSNGYLVFTPDIYYKTGDPMQGTYNAMISAAKYVSRLSFVDEKKMGIQGCSFGGLQTNYLITHSSLFAAAVSSSSLSNLISGYGSLSGEGQSFQSSFETGQIRMGGSLWEKPESYINNSPIFNVDKVTTPFLMMHTKKDGSACSFTDAIQFFTALRRLGKKSWMLAYSQGNHGLQGDEAKDFSIRMMQFFNHYLKDKPMPTWMLHSKLLVDKQNRETALGDERNIFEDNILIPKEREKLDSLMTKKPITVTLK